MNYKDKLTEEEYKRLVKCRKQKKVFGSVAGLLVPFIALPAIVGIIWIFVALIMPACPFKEYALVHFGIFLVPMIALPIIWVILYFVFQTKVGKQTASVIEALLQNNAIDADNLMQIGHDFDMWEMSKYAFERRTEELGITRIPESYYRDGILPTNEDVQKDPSKFGLKS